MDGRRDGDDAAVFPRTRGAVRVGDLAQARRHAHQRRLRRDALRRAHVGFDSGLEGTQTRVLLHHALDLRRGTRVILRGVLRGALRVARDRRVRAGRRPGRVQRLHGVPALGQPRGVAHRHRDVLDPRLGARRRTGVGDTPALHLEAAPTAVHHPARGAALDDPVHVRVAVPLRGGGRLSRGEGDAHEDGQGQRADGRDEGAAQGYARGSRRCVGGEARGLGRVRAVHEGGG